MYNCPKCNSKDVLVGAFVLDCNTCGWNYNNKYPCDICGEPAYSAAGYNGKHIRRCKTHSISHDDLVNFFKGAKRP